MFLIKKFGNYAAYKKSVATNIYFDPKHKREIQSTAILDSDGWHVNVPIIGKKQDQDRKILCDSFDALVMVMAEFEQNCKEAKLSPVSPKSKADFNDYKQIAVGENYHLSYQGTLHKTTKEGLIIDAGAFQLSQFNSAAEKQKKISGVQEKNTVFDQIIESMVDRYCLPKNLQNPDFETPENFKARKYENIVRELIEQTFSDHEITVEDYQLLSKNAIEALQSATGDELLSHKVIIGLNTLEVGIDLGRKIYQDILQGENPKSLSQLDDLIEEIEVLSDTLGCNEYLYELKSTIMSDDQLPNLDYIFHKTADTFSAKYSEATKPKPPENQKISGNKGTNSSGPK